MKNVELIIENEFIQAQTILKEFIGEKKNFEAIEKASDLMIEAIKNGNKIISCGNGGSFCDAMHFAEELSGRFRENRKAIPALAISDASHITCVGNDFGFDEIFSRYIESIGKSGDVLLAISTSGNSKNVINASLQAKEQNIKIVGLTGKDGGKLSDFCDVEIRVPHFEYADRIQEIHIKIIHIFILLIERGL